MVNALSFRGVLVALVLALAPMGTAFGSSAAVDRLVASTVKKIDRAADSAIRKGTNLYNSAYEQVEAMVEAELASGRENFGPAKALIVSTVKKLQELQSKTDRSIDKQVSSAEKKLMRMADRDDSLSEEIDAALEELEIAALEAKDRMDSEMQNAYDEIEQETSPYFQVELPTRDEE